jgi:hypothetical protein
MVHIPLVSFLRGLRSENGLAFVPESERRAGQPMLTAAGTGVFRNWLAEIFALDVRSLVLFRVSVALVVLADLAARSGDLRDHYTDVGILPRATAIAEYGRYGFLSLHLFGGSALSQSVLFVTAALCAIGLLAGYRTRLMTVLSWALLVSLHNRNPMVIDGGDDFLRVILFWAMFLPLGTAYSLDGVLAPPAATARRIPERVVSVASAALILQLCFMYWFTVVLKSDPIWRTEGSALYYALNLDSFATPFGVWFRDFSALLPLLTFATLAIEAVGPCLLFLPFTQGPIRFFVVCTFLGLHTGMGLCLALGVFPFIVGAAWLALLPSWFWNRLNLAHDLSFLQKTILQQRFEAWHGTEPYRRLVARAAAPVWRPTVMVPFCALCLGYVFLWNLRTTDFDRFKVILPIESNWFGHTLRLDQKWGMFAPRPAADDGWYVIPGRLRDGSEVDVFANGAPVSWAKPAVVSDTFRNQRWRKYLRNIWERDHAAHRLYFGQYVCRSWNAAHSNQSTLETFRIYYVKEETLPGGKIAEPEKVLIWRHRCF